METKNESEKVFEQYLDTNGFKCKWTYEPSGYGNTRPDYLLECNNEKYFFEVKELRKKSDGPIERATSANLYSSLRTEINEVRKQFKEYKQYSCSLVVFNVSDSTVLFDPLFILGAMLGDLGLQAYYNPDRGEVVSGSIRNAFLNGGKMIDYKGKRKQNTTISAILLLEEFLDNIEIEKAMRNEEQKHGRIFKGQEWIDIRMKLHKDHPMERVARIVVMENPFARMPLPSDLFNGPFDERWRWTNSNIERVFWGSKLKELEVLKKNRPNSSS